MNSVSECYLRECRKQRVAAYEPFIANADSGSIEADLTGVSASTIQLFAAALLEMRTAEHVSLSFSNSLVNVSDVRVLSSSSGASHLSDAANQSGAQNAGKNNSAGGVFGMSGSVSSANRALDKSVLQRICLRWGVPSVFSAFRGNSTKSSVSSRGPDASFASSRMKKNMANMKGMNDDTLDSQPSLSGMSTSTLPPHSVSEIPIMGSNEGCGMPKRFLSVLHTFSSALPSSQTFLDSGSAGTPSAVVPKGSRGHAITSDTADVKATLSALLDGIHHAILCSVEHIHTIEFVDFPFALVPEKGARLFQAISMCSYLEVLHVDGSRLTAGHLTTLTATSRAFARLVDASFAYCGLTNNSQRAIVSLLKLHRDYDGEATLCSLSMLDGRGGVDLSPPGTPASLISPVAVSSPPSSVAHTGATGEGDGHFPSGPSTLSTFSSCPTAAPSTAVPIRSHGSSVNTTIWTRGTTLTGGGSNEGRLLSPVSHVRGLRRLDVSHNELGDATLTTITSALMQTKNGALEYLNVSDNKITAAGLGDFLHSGVLQTCGLQLVDCSRNEGVSVDLRERGRINGNEVPRAEEEEDEKKKDTENGEHAATSSSRDVPHLSPTGAVLIPISVWQRYDCMATDAGQVMFTARPPPSPPALPTRSLAMDTTPPPLSAEVTRTDASGMADGVSPLKRHGKRSSGRRTAAPHSSSQRSPFSPKHKPPHGSKRNSTLDEKHRIASSTHAVAEGGNEGGGGRSRNAFFSSSSFHVYSRRTSLASSFSSYSSSRPSLRASSSHSYGGHRRRRSSRLGSRVDPKALPHAEDPSSNRRRRPSSSLSLSIYSSSSGSSSPRSTDSPSLPSSPVHRRPFSRASSASLSTHRHTPSADDRRRSMRSSASRGTSAASSSYSRSRHVSTDSGKGSIRSIQGKRRKRRSDGGSARLPSTLQSNRSLPSVPSVDEAPPRRASGRSSFDSRQKVNPKERSDPITKEKENEKEKKERKSAEGRDPSAVSQSASWRRPLEAAALSSSTAVLSGHISKVLAGSPKKGTPVEDEEGGRSAQEGHHDAIVAKDGDALLASSPSFAAALTPPLAEDHLTSAIISKFTAGVAARQKTALQPSVDGSRASSSSMFRFSPSIGGNPTDDSKRKEERSAFAKSLRSASHSFTRGKDADAHHEMAVSNAKKREKKVKKMVQEGNEEERRPHVLQASLLSPQGMKSAAPRLASSTVVQQQLAAWEKERQEIGSPSRVRSSLVVEEKKHVSHPISIASGVVPKKERRGRGEKPPLKPSAVSSTQKRSGMPPYASERRATATPAAAKRRENRKSMHASSLSGRSATLAPAVVRGRDLKPPHQNSRMISSMEKQQKRLLEAHRQRMLKQNILHTTTNRKKEGQGEPMAAQERRVIPPSAADDLSSRPNAMVSHSSATAVAHSSIVQSHSPHHKMASAIQKVPPPPTTTTITTDVRSPVIRASSPHRKASASIALPSFASQSALESSASQEEEESTTSSGDSDKHEWGKEEATPKPLSRRHASEPEIMVSSPIQIPFSAPASQNARLARKSHTNASHLSSSSHATILRASSSHASALSAEKAAAQEHRAHRAHHVDAPQATPHRFVPSSSFIPPRHDGPLWEEDTKKRKRHLTAWMAPAPRAGFTPRDLPSPTTLSRGRRHHHPTTTPQASVKHYRRRSSTSSCNTSSSSSCNSSSSSVRGSDRHHFHHRRRASVSTSSVDLGDARRVSTRENHASAHAVSHRHRVSAPKHADEEWEGGEGGGRRQADDRPLKRGRHHTERRSVFPSASVPSYGPPPSFAPLLSPPPPPGFPCYLPFPPWGAAVPPPPLCAPPWDEAVRKAEGSEAVQRRRSGGEGADSTPTRLSASLPHDEISHHTAVPMQEARASSIGSSLSPSSCVRSSSFAPFPYAYYSYYPYSYGGADGHPPSSFPTPPHGMYPPLGYPFPLSPPGFPPHSSFPTSFSSSAAQRGRGGPRHPTRKASLNRLDSDPADESVSFSSFSSDRFHRHPSFIDASPSPSHRTHRKGEDPRTTGWERTKEAKKEHYPTRHHYGHRLEGEDRESMQRSTASDDSLMGEKGKRRKEGIKRSLLPEDPFFAAVARAEEEGEHWAEEERQRWRERIPVAVRELLASEVDHEKVISAPFLEALVGRLEDHENSCIERLESQQHGTREQFQEMEKKFQGQWRTVEERLEYVLALERALKRERQLYAATCKADEAEMAWKQHEEDTERNHVASVGREQKQYQHDERESSPASPLLQRDRTTPGHDHALDENQLRLELMELIHTGIQRLQEQVFSERSGDGAMEGVAKDEKKQSGNANHTTSRDHSFVKKSDGVLSRYTAALKNEETREAEEQQHARKDYISIVQERLEKLGW